MRGVTPVLGWVAQAAAVLGTLAGGVTVALTASPPAVPAAPSAMAVTTSPPAAAAAGGLAVLAQPRVRVLVDGTERAVRSAPRDVDHLLGSLDIAIGPGDVVLPARAAAITDGLVVRVVRVATSTVEQDEVVPAGSRERLDPTAAAGTRRIARAAVAGVVRRSYAVTTHDGVQVAAKPVGEQVISSPVDEVIAVGTRVGPPAPAPTTAPTPAATPPTARPGLPQPSLAPLPLPVPSALPPVADGPNFAALARCESGGNPRARSANGLYFGLYQFDLQTWRAVGGTGNPADASPAEQTARARALYAQRGRSPWPVCGKYL